MKKILLVCLFCVLFLTGCGEKTLICINSSRGGIDEGFYVELLWNDKYTFTFKGKNLVRLVERTEAILDEVEYLDDVENYLRTELDEYADVGVTTFVQKEDEKVIYEITYEVKELTDNFKSDFLYADKTMDEIISILEEEEFICK